MITLSMIETLIRDNEAEVNTDIALFQSIMNKKNNEIKNEIKEMENYAGYTEDEKEELKAMKRFQFMRDQNIVLIEFLIDQFTKREVFLESLEK